MPFRFSKRFFDIMGPLTFPFFKAWVEALSHYALLIREGRFPVRKKTARRDIDHFADGRFAKMKQG